MDHKEVIQLLIAYTLVGAFIFTVVITCLSLIGWVKLANSRQQQKLFSILTVELVVGCLAFFFNFLTLNPSSVVKSIEDKAVAIHDARFDAIRARINTIPRGKLIEAQAKASRLSSADLNEIIDARDPGKLREKDPDMARFILEWRLVLGSHSASEIDSFESIINESR